MKEHFLAFVWQHKLIRPTELFTTDGRSITLTHPGFLNEDAGPDFKEAHLQISGMHWAGHVELHVNASDWMKHKHQFDLAYDSVILHVVYNADQKIYRKNGTEIPCLELKGKIPKEYYHRYRNLHETVHWLPCQNHIASIRPIIIRSTLNKMAIERLMMKVTVIEERLEQLQSDWSQLIFEQLAHGLGFKINGFIFEQIARSIPIKIILKEGQNPNHLEALFYGQAQLLNVAEDDYSQRLQNLYTYLQTKYGLEPIPPGQLKFLRTRPSNFPTVRLAQLSAIFASTDHLCHYILEIETMIEWRHIMSAEVPDYWQEHYDFGKPSSKRQNRQMSASSIHLLAINVLIPLLFAYARYLGSEARMNKALEMLNDIPAENNKFIRRWKSVNVHPTSALESQGLLHLEKEYCTHHKCLSCSIGHNIICSNKD